MAAAAQPLAPAGRDLLGQVAWYVPSALVPAAMALLSAAVFTRMFSAGEYGRFSLVISVAGFVSALSSQWLQQGITRFFPGERDESVSTERRSAVALGLAGVWIVVGLAGVLLALGSRVAGSVWAAWILPATLVSLGAASFNILGAVLQSDMRARQYSVYRIAEAVLRFTFAIAVLGIVAREATSLAWGSALSVLFVVPLMWRDAGIPVRALAASSARALRSMAEYGIPMVGWYLAALLLDVGDRLLIQLLRGPAEVGLYSANWNLVYGGVSLLAAPMLLAAHPFLMRAWSGGHTEQAARWLGRIAEWYLVAGVLATGVVWLLGREIAAALLGPDFRPGWVILAPVVGGLVLWQLGMYMHKPLEFAGRTRLMFAVALAVAVLKIALNVALLPRFGYVAAAWSTLICFTIYAATTFYLGRRLLRWSLDWRRVSLVGVPLIAALWLGRGLPLALRIALAGAATVAVIASEWHVIRGDLNDGERGDR